jgi:hypothetical protein
VADEFVVTCPYCGEQVEMYVEEDVRGSFAVVEGRLLRSVVSGKVLECWPDGTLIYAADAVEYLCWGPKTRGAVRRINPMALVESSYLFARLVEAVYSQHAAPVPTSVRWTLALHRLQVGGTTSLSPGGINSVAFRSNSDLRPAPLREAEFTFDTGFPCLPTLVAGELVRRVFTWFGHTEDTIPYVARRDHDWIIAPDKILADIS